MPAVIGIGKRIAAVDLIELTVRPAQGVAQPSRGVAPLFLEQEFEPVGFPHPLRDLVFPVGIEGICETRSLPIAQQARHRFVVSLDAALDTSESLGPPEGPLLTGLWSHPVGRRYPEVGRQGQSLVGQQVHELVHPRVRCLDGTSVRQPIIQ